MKERVILKSNVSKDKEKKLAGWWCIDWCSSQFHLLDLCCNLCQVLNEGLNLKNKRNNQNLFFFNLYRYLFLIGHQLLKEIAASRRSSKSGNQTSAPTQALEHKPNTTPCYCSWYNKSISLSMYTYRNFIIRETEVSKVWFNYGLQ